MLTKPLTKKSKVMKPLPSLSKRRIKPGTVKLQSLCRLTASCDNHDRVALGIKDGNLQV